MTENEPTLRNGPATSLGERTVRCIEEMAPVVPMAVCFMWGVLLILLSFALDLAKFQVGSKWLGWIYEINWSFTFAFFIPLSVYLCSSALTAVPQVIATLARGRMVRNESGDLAGSGALISSWRKLAGKTAYLALALGALGFAVSWVMYFAYCIGPLAGWFKVGSMSWQNATTIAPGVSNRASLAVFGFLAYTSQGAAICIFIYYILIIFTFAVWVFQNTQIEPNSGIYPDLSETDTRFGFERFEPLIENVLLASIALFFQFFMTRLYYIYISDKASTSMFDLIARTMGPGFIQDVGALFLKRDPSIFAFGSDLHFQDTMMITATLIVVLSAFLVPAVIVRQAAWRSRVKLQEMIQSAPDVSSRWYNLTADEAQTKLEKMTFWPIRYAEPIQLLLLFLLAGACFFAYKLSLLLVGAILYKGACRFLEVFKG